MSPEMMTIRFDDKLELVMPKKLAKQSKITSYTPQHRFLHTHWHDISSEMGALRAIFLSLPKMKTVTDLLAGCGFSGRMIQHYLQPDILRLNDLDIGCADILRDNFPKAKVTQKDAHAYSWGNQKSDLTWFDFNTFTLAHWGDWVADLHRAGEHSEYLMAIDSACYGFRFGNLPRYGCQTEADYYDRMALKYKEIGFGLIQVAKFGNAAILLSKRKSRKKWAFVESASAPMDVKEGFGLWTWS